MLHDTIGMLIISPIGLQATLMVQQRINLCRQYGATGRTHLSK